jgi:hypothetical protein
VLDETVGIERKTGSDFAKSLFDGRLARYRHSSAATSDQSCCWRGSPGVRRRRVSAGRRCAAQ